MKRIFTALAAALLGLTVSCGGQPTNDVIHGPEATGPAVQIPAESAPPGVDQVVWEELTARLTQELSRTGSAAPAIAVPQGAAGSVTDLRLETDGDDTASLDWSYVNLGDYNLDGLVSAADLTPVGIYFECNTESPNWLEASRADGNGDGYIGLADVTVIGQNYQHRVDGYRIETSDNPGNPLGWLPHAAVPFTTAVLNAEGSRLVFSSGEITLWEGMSYRVAPYADIEPQLEYGPGSNLVTWTGNAPEAPLGLQASDGEFVGRIALSWASVPDASYYLVYRDQPDNEIGLTLSPVYEEYVTGDYGAHEYWVRAGNAIGESGLSDGDTGFSGLAAPTGVTATAGLYADRVELSWEPVDGAEGYEVFRDGGAAPAGLIGDASNWDDTEADLLMRG